jgi:hypothetical protein
MEIEFNQRRLKQRITKVKYVLPLAEQIMRLKVGIGELLAFHSAVYEKADMEKIPLDIAAYGPVSTTVQQSRLPEFYLVS